MTLPIVSSIQAAIQQLADELEVLPAESITIHSAAGRVLAEDLLADRDSPALDVSAMDGYALRMQDIIKDHKIAVASTCAAGHAATELPAGGAVRIFTGAPVPDAAECVIKREDTLELESQIQVRIPVDQIAKGANIRRRGENSLAGDTIIAKGTYVDSAAIAALASFGTPRVSVLNKVRIAILNTGDELAQPGEPVEDWQIRDSNGPTLKAWLAQLPWAEVTEVQHVGDTLEQVQATLKEQLQRVDAIILTGGVSMGDTDYVPKAVESIGGEIHFHRLPLRPGRPVLGAARDGKLILGLPGNPVSVAVTSRVIGLPLLRKMAGLKPILVTPPEVTLEESDDRSLHLVWYRLVEAGADGKLRLAASKGSGDLVSLARSVGFVRLPAGDSGCGPWPFYAWE